MGLFARDGTVRNTAWLGFMVQCNLVMFSRIVGNHRGAIIFSFSSKLMLELKQFDAVVVANVWGSYYSVCATLSCCVSAENTYVPIWLLPL
jgi:hypothetical protein